MPLDKGTNEWDGDEGEEKDEHEPDWDSINDNIWLSEHDDDDEMEIEVELEDDDS